MNISLIAPIMFDLGVFTIAPQLKTKGHKVNIIFIPDLMRECYAPEKISNKTVNRICEFLQPSDFIGINCLSENYLKTSIFVDYIKKRLNKPLVWGGIHATLRPQDCIRHADIVCVGEGEEAIVELACKMERKEPIENINNMIFKDTNPKMTGLMLRPPINLNLLKPFDYDLEYQYVVEGENIRKVKENDFKGNFLSYSSRGCPFRCSYCCNSTTLDKTYKGQKYCRQRSVDNVIEELRGIKSKFVSCKSIWFNEADFLHGKDQVTIDDFSRKCKAEINTPFYIWTNPASINEYNIPSLVSAGLRGTNIGTINANPEIQRGVYNRTATSALYMRASTILKNNNVSVEYDLILCNPYEKKEHIINNINLLRSFPLPFKTVIYSLTYFSDTALFERAVKDGIINRESHTSSYIEAAYKAWFFNDENTYLNGIASMMRGHARRVKLFGKVYGLLPDAIVAILISKPFVKFFSLRLFKLTLYPLLGIIIKMIYVMIVRVVKFYRIYMQKFIQCSQESK